MVLEFAQRHWLARAGRAISIHLYAEPGVAVWEAAEEHLEVLVSVKVLDRNA